MNVGDIVRYKSVHGLSRIYYGIIIDIADVTHDGATMLVLLMTEI